ncbi:anti-sigma factor family protein [Altererythrobacter sp. GH1-8]|uniref:anti-sigma factor family protein n=1 Tax=Altererythrobacter sp. GH1-8 TaxID=3349333 RepID=UPI00374DA8B6
MSVTPEELAAFADGQLEGEELARVTAAIEADPELARQVEAHRKLAGMLGSHYAPILEQDVPDRLTQMLRETKEPDGAAVVDFAAAKDRREARRTLPSWGWGGGAIAAALVAAVMLNLGGGSVEDGYAGTRLASALDTQLVADQSAGADTRILLSFRNEANEFCRAYANVSESGIACRDDQGWRQQVLGHGSESGSTEFRMAGSEAEILATAQEMATGPALSAEEEMAARKAGWQE